MVRVYVGSDEKVRVSIRSRHDLADGMYGGQCIGLIFALDKNFYPIKRSVS